MAFDLAEYPRFTVNERDRRWARIRDLMRVRGCDCLVAPGLRDGEEQATSRYLSQIGGIGLNAWVAFPLAGAPTAFVDSDRNQAFAVRMQDWITDIRIGPPSSTVPERLKELELDTGRIGFTELGGDHRFGEGNIPHETMRKLNEALPRAEVYPENEVLGLARVVKGPEEVEVIEQVAAADEAAIRAMCDSARPGTPQADVWRAMADALIRQSDGFPARLSVTFDGNANQTLGMPIPDRIADGALCSQEICARIRGYRAQCNHTIKVGSGGPRDYLDVMRATIAVYDEMLAWLHAGVTVGELFERYADLVRSQGEAWRGSCSVHTNGLGNDYPRVSSERPRRHGEDAVVLEPGVTFTLKHSLTAPSRTRTQYGEPLTITESGARRLGKRAHEPIVVGAS